MPSCQPGADSPFHELEDKYADGRETLLEAVEEMAKQDPPPMVDTIGQTIGLDTDPELYYVWVDEDDQIHQLCRGIDPFCVQTSVIHHTMTNIEVPSGVPLAAMTSLSTGHTWIAKRVKVEDARKVMAAVLDAIGLTRE